MGLDQSGLSGVTSLYIPEQLQLAGLLNRQLGVASSPRHSHHTEATNVFGLRLPTVRVPSKYAESARLDFSQFILK